jgi:hypothetical protein
VASGVSGSGEAGTYGPQITVALSGEPATASVGDVTTSGGTTAPAAEPDLIVRVEILLASVEVQPMAGTVVIGPFTETFEV